LQSELNVSIIVALENGDFEMRGNPEVVDYLNMLIGGELAARDQYLIHSRMYEDWGLSKIFERIDHEMQEEAQHADAIIRRVLFLEGTPNMQRDDVEIGEDDQSPISGKSSAIAEVKGMSSKTITIDSNNVGNARAAPSTKLSIKLKIKIA
jgi:bacterioferritin (cytochrome b1)